MDRAGPSAPRTGDYVDWDAWLTRFPTPHPGRPVPTPDPKVTFGASPVKCRAAWAADGRHPGRHQIMPALFSEPDLCGLATLRVLLSRSSSPGFNVSHFLERRVREGNAKIFRWAVARGQEQEEPPAGALEGAPWRMGGRLPDLTPSRSKARSHAHTWRPSVSGHSRSLETHLFGRLRLR